MCGVCVAQLTYEEGDEKQDVYLQKFIYSWNEEEKYRSPYIK